MYKKSELDGIEINHDKEENIFHVLKNDQKIGYIKYTKEDINDLNVIRIDFIQRQTEDLKGGFHLLYPYIIDKGLCDVIRSDIRRTDDGLNLWDRIIANNSEHVIHEVYSNIPSTSHDDSDFETVTRDSYYILSRYIKLNKEYFNTKNTYGGFSIRQKS